MTAYSNPVGAFNRYWYANNNSYKFTDPDGRQSESVMDRRYVYPNLSSSQVAGLEARHNEIGEQAFTGMAIGASLVAGPELLAVRGVAPVVFSLRGGTKGALDRLSRRAINSENKSTGNINIRMPGGEAGWRNAQRELGRLNIDSVSSTSGGAVVRGTTRDAASVEIRNFSKDGSLTIKVQEAGSRIKRMFRFKAAPE